MPPQPGTMRSRWTAYAAVSTTLAAGVILKALAQRPNFYSASVYLSQSSANLMILCNMVFVTACSCLIFLQKFLYGPLRPIEIEQLYEKAWFAVTETCLAMTIFRGEIGAWFLVMFFSLLAGKVWGWIGEGRVEVLEQQQHNILAGRGARLFHTRLAASLALSVLFDMTMLDYVVGQVLHMARPDMMVMFGFEFAVLTVTSLSTATRYSLNLIEIGIVRGQKMKRIENIRKERVDAAVREIEGQGNTRSNEDGAQPAASEELERRRTEAAAAAAAIPIDEAEVEVEGWEGKGRWIFYLDLTTDFCKLVIYLSFFFILLIFYGLPLHIMRDVFLTCRSFIKRIGDFMRYRTATRDMNERYPDATEAEIGDNECIICREEMRPYVPPAPGAATDPLTERMRPKKLPCGHVLHFACLRSWLERQQICPTCRATVVPSVPAPAGAAPAVPGAAARAQHPQNGGNRGPRVFQIGPLRIGVGAARGNNMFEELQEQLANLNALPPPPPPPVPPQNGNGPQQYGFGIRWDGIRRRAQGHRAPRGSVQDHLDSIERQIQRELDSLQASMGELQALRDVQAQLARIRLARQGTPISTVQPTGTQIVPPVPRSTAGTTVTGLTAQPQQGVLQAGSQQLPDGLTLPEGWTMMPLQPMQPMQAQPVPPSVFQPPPMFAGIPGMDQVAQMLHTHQAPPMHQMPQMHQTPQVPQGPIVVPPEPQPEAPQDTPLANILRETREVLRATSPRSEISDGANGRQASDQDPLAETIRLQQEVAESRQRMAELTGQLRGIGQNIANATAEGQAASANSTRAPPSSAHMQSTSRQSRTEDPPTQTTSSSIRSSPSSQQNRQPLIPEQARQSFSAPPQSAPLQSRVQQAPVSSPIPQRAPQMTRSPPSATNTGTTSRPTTGISVNPPRQLTPNSQVSNSSASESRTRSPHRPTRSIGSSWGFSGVEQDKKKSVVDDEDDDDDEDEDKNEDKDEDEDTTDSDEEDEPSNVTRKTNGSSGESTGVNGTTTTTTSNSRVAKGKSPTVEELVEDPD